MGAYLLNQVKGLCLHSELQVQHDGDTGTPLLSEEVVV